MDKDNLEMLLEDIRGKFDLVLEGHDALRKDIQDTREELCEKINLVDFKVGTLNQKIDNVDARLSEKIDDVDVRLSKKIDDVDARLSKKIDDVDVRLSKKIDDVDARLSKKIDDVEERLSVKIDAVAVDLKEHRADTEVHKKVYKIKDE